MKALVVYCHPSPESFTAGVRDRVMSKLEAAGATVTLIDLYGEGFDPVLSRVAWETYLDGPDAQPSLAAHVEAIRTSDCMIFVYPTWWYGMPSMLKGWLDRVFLPDVCFHLPETGPIEPRLTHVTRLGVFTTCGASWGLTRFIGAPGRRTLLRGVRLLCAKRCRTGFAAHYRMDSSTPESRTRHLALVDRKMDRLLRPM